jgi:hypothetical protein
MSVFYYNSDGDAIAWRRDDDDSFLFNNDAEPVGWFPWDDEDAYSMDGEYLGTIVDEERLLRRTYQPYRGYPGTPGYVGYVGYAGSAGRLGYLGYRIGFEDVPEHMLAGDPANRSSADLTHSSPDDHATAQAAGLLFGAAALIGSVAALAQVTNRWKERRAREQAELAAQNPAPTTAPAGWYPNHGTLRFWDGTAWTPHIAPMGSMPPPVTFVDRRPPAGGVLAVTAWIIALMTVGYMVPWAVAVSRRTTNQAQVGLVNFLLGWTIAGWFVALVMAVRPEPSRSSVLW